MRALLVLALLGGTAATARAERPLHGSVGAGGSLLWTGSGGDRFRLDVHAELKPSSRYGVQLAWRAFDEHHRGLVMAGLVYEGAAARPTLVIDLHADAGADLDAKAPLVGGGLRTTLTITGPLGVALDAGAYLIIDGVDNSRLQLQSNLVIVARW